MNIVCVICSDLLVPSDDVFITPCGHIFHYGCLIQWMERSKTCPQCRERVTEQKIHRIYFNFSNSDSIVEDSSSLQNRVDNLIFQLNLKNNEIKDLTETKEKLKTQTTSLIQTVKYVEHEIKSKDSTIRALQSQIKFHKRQYLEIADYKTENEQLKEEVKSLKDKKVLLEGSVDEVDEMITKTQDPGKLATYTIALKRELVVNFDKTRKLRDIVNNLKHQLIQSQKKNNILSEEHAKRRQLEEQLMVCESQKISLQAQLLEMQACTDKCACDKVPAEKQNNSKTHNEHNLEKECNTTMNENDCVVCESPKLYDTPKRKKNDSCIIISDTENTPQNVKSKGVFTIKSHGIKRTSSNVKIPSILAKKSKFNQPCQKTVSDNGMTFDGFGGHAKYDQFPSSTSNLHVRKIREETKKSKYR